MHMFSVLFLVRLNNFALTTYFYWSYMLLLKSPVLMLLALLLHATQRVNKLPLWMKKYYGRISEHYATASKAKLCALIGIETVCFN